MRASRPPTASTIHVIGRENDGAGLYYYRARYYDPIGSRFVGEDPIGLAGGANTYQYAASSPLNYIDPLGLKACCNTNTTYSECLARCVERYRFDWRAVTATNLGNAAANAAAGGTGRSGVGGTPPHATSWQHKAGGALSRATGNPAWGQLGRALGRAMLVPLVLEGYYDIGTIGRCAVVCEDCSNRDNP